MIKRCLIFASLLALPHLGHAQTFKPALAEDPLLRSIIDSGRFVDFNPVPLKEFDGGVFLPKDAECLSLQGEQFEHVDGIYGSRQIKFVKYPIKNNFQGFLLAAENSYLVFNDTVKTLTDEECLAKALELRQQIWPDFAVGAALEPKSRISGEGTAITVSWRAFDEEGKFQRTVEIGIRRNDGKCVYLKANEDDLDAPFTAPEALAKVREIVAHTTTLSDVKLRDWKLSRGIYRIQFDVRHNNENKILYLTVNGADGYTPDVLDLRKEPINFDGDDWLRCGGPIVMLGTWSAGWTQRGLVYLTDQQPLIGEGQVRNRFSSKLILRDWQGRNSIIYNGSLSDILFTAPWSDWIIFKNYSSTYALNLRDGSLKPLDNLVKKPTYLDVLSASMLPTTANSQSGAAGPKFLMTSGRSNSSYGFDIYQGFMASLKNSPVKTPAKPLPWKYHSLFSPDGKNLYFTVPQEDSYSLKVNTSICRISAEKFLRLSSQPKVNLLRQSVQVYSIKGNVLDLQIYPSGEQLLIVSGRDYRTEVRVVNLKTHRTTFISSDLVKKKNPESEFSIREVKPGRNNLELLLVGRRNELYNGVYVSNLDGSGLKRFTPPTPGAKPVKYHHFVAGGSAYDIAKRLALSSLKQGKNIER